MKLAVLITCHNRKEKTLACLHSFYKLEHPKYKIDFVVYLVDDGSTDGTSELVIENFSEVRIIKGTGKLYWNKGMRLAWQTAAQIESYDFYLWLNDDVLLYKFALSELFESYQKGLALTNKESVVTAAFTNTKEGLHFSYGGRTDKGPVIPNGTIQECKYINGNMVLIPKIIFEEVGILSSSYTHTMGDYDYGLRVLRAGFANVTTTKYVGACKLNESPKWADAKIPLSDRKKLFYSPNGLNFKEYVTFRKKFWKSNWYIFLLKAYLKLYLPKYYSLLTK